MRNRREKNLSPLTVVLARSISNNETLTHLKGKDA